MSNFEVTYAHTMCHPETCCHEDDWQVREDGCVIMYCETREEAEECAEFFRKRENQ